MTFLRVTTWLLILAWIAASSAAKAQEPSRAPVQSIYRQGVPHTDKTGKPMKAYDPQQSFFQIAMWGAPLSHGAPYGYAYDWQTVKDAGFNTVWTWVSMPEIEAMQDAVAKDMQVVFMGNQHGIPVLQQIADNATYRNHLLGIMWQDEATTVIPMNEMQASYNQFLAYRQSVHQVLPHLPVFINDGHAFTNNTEQRNWWLKWAKAGDLTSQDNYPVRAGGTTSIGKNDGPPGISESISLATATLNEQRPVWAIVGAFGDNAPDDASFAFRFPTPTQMRAQVYTALIHGATGIVYFAWDTYLMRSAGNFGISPNPLPNGYTLNGQPNSPYQAAATPEQLQQSTALWAAVATINTELQALAPMVLSPTIDRPELSYTVQLSNLSAPNNESLYSNSPIRTLLKRDADGRYLLLAVNLDNRSMDVRFDFSKTFEQIGLMFEESGTLGELHGVRQFTYHFTPFDTNVFMLTLSAQPGDFDGDGDVDGADFVAWQTHFPVASGANRSIGDADGDGDVDGADFVIWQTHFPTAGSAAETAVPEPLGILLMIAGCFVLFVLCPERARCQGRRAGVD